MSSGNMLKKKKGIQLPHIYVLLFAIIVVCTILTWVLPAGEFDRVVNEATGRTVAVAGTFHTVEQSPVGIFQMFQAIYNGMCDAGSVTFFVFISYASINIIISSGAFNGLVAGLLKVFKGKARWPSSPSLCSSWASPLPPSVCSRSGSPSCPSSPGSPWPWALTLWWAWPSLPSAPPWATPAL